MPWPLAWACSALASLPEIAVGASEPAAAQQPCRSATETDRRHEETKQSAASPHNQTRRKPNTTKYIKILYNKNNTLTAKKAKPKIEKNGRLLVRITRENPLLQRDYGSTASPDELEEELVDPLLSDASASASSDWREMTPTGKQSLHLCVYSSSGGTIWP